MKGFRYLFDIPFYQLEQFPQKVSGGSWHQEIEEEISSAALALLVQHIAISLIRSGVQKGDRVLLLSDKYSMFWLAADMAIMASGAISTPVHYPIPDKDLAQILRNIQPILIIQSFPVDKDEVVDPYKRIYLNDLSSNPASLSEQDLKVLSSIRDETRLDDIATIVHTSGSSGEPRAVCLSHGNVVSNVKSVLALVPFTKGTRVLSFLPLSHIFERIVCYIYLACGVNIYFLETYRHALWALKDIRPQYFTSVPLVLERFAAALEDRIEEGSWFSRWAYQSWEKQNRGFLSHIGSLIAHQWIIKRWKRTLGGRLKGIICGAAYLDSKVEKLYERSGIRIRQGYGLTEASPVIAMNHFEPGGHKRGTVGLPVPGVTVHIAADGEVLAAGPNIMKGYYKDEAATQQAIREGWLYTGDIGYLDEDGFLVITDRKSNIFKHASGKFIAPAKIESILDHHPLIHHAMIVGFQRPYTIALIIPHFDRLQKECKDRNIHWTAPEYMVHNTMVIGLYREVLDSLDLQLHERIEKFILLADTWSPENGLLSTTFKPRRHEITQRYKKEIEALYE